ncbi:hypothetical protein [Paenibacillus sp. OV219]|uniref:hypothetical protein n=1 Tax=Paenibacillus sp. OV219 TaxID=1884377 RepID=UPI0008BB5ADD|nr:hypothetical protein [Paenibacillus sp. OV219]SEM65575.1 hypothetical protein SAMN05518847_101436 [Paenibacillus sp. OV219]
MVVVIVVIDGETVLRGGLFVIVRELSAAWGRNQLSAYVAGLLDLFAHSNQLSAYVAGSLDFFTLSNQLSAYVAGLLDLFAHSNQLSTYVAGLLDLFAKPIEMNQAFLSKPIVVVPPSAQEGYSVPFIHIIS